MPLHLKIAIRRGGTFPPLEDAMYADANATLPNPDGTPGTTPNPYAGRLYMEENWVSRTHNESDRVYRATLAYQFAPRKFAWLGKHRLAGLIERHESDIIEDNLLEVWDIWSAVPPAMRATFTSTMVSTSIEQSPAPAQRAGSLRPGRASPAALPSGGRRGRAGGHTL